MEINDDQLDAFRSDFHDALKKLEEKYDITIKSGRITYYDNYFTFKVTVNNSRDPEVIASDNFNREVWKYEDAGLKEGMYRQMFIGTDGMKYALMGIRENAKKSPLRIKRLSDGKWFRCEPGFIREIMHAKYIDNLAD